VQPAKKKQGHGARPSQGQSIIQAENTLQASSSIKSKQFSKDVTKISIRSSISTGNWDKKG